MVVWLLGRMTAAVADGNPSRRLRQMLGFVDAALPRRSGMRCRRVAAMF